VNEETRSVIVLAKRAEDSAWTEWLRAVNELDQVPSNQGAERADRARDAWRAADKRLTDLKEQARQGG